MTTNTDQNETVQASCAPAAGYAAGVEYPAALIVHTPSGPVASCEAHAAKIKALMAFMGAHTNATPAPEGAECVNCRNESKRHTEKLSV